MESSANLSNGQNEWCKGKIYSVEVKDFVTYDHVMYYPGEYLNIILGPNGTGKSTIVAAIVLGMGGQPKTLSRSQNIEDYVKNGKERAEIEIMLFKDSLHKSKFKRTFNINGQNKYYVDNAEVSLKKYVEHVALFNIQINNLCQFLPQDRVQDFAKMNPQELLTNTQGSVCSAACVEKFEKLKQLRSEQKGDITSLATQINKLNENEGKVAGLKEQVDNINLKSTLSEQYDVCTKKKAWMEFEELFIKFKEIENDVEKGNENKKRAEDELAPLKQQSSQITKKKQVHQANIKTESDKFQSLSGELNKLDEKSCKLEESIVKAEGDLQFAKQNDEENKKELELALLHQQALVEDVKKSTAIAGSENDKKTQIDEIMKESAGYVEKVHVLTGSNRKAIRQLNEEIKPRLNSINDKIKTLENSKNVKLELIRSRFDQVYQAVIWLRQNQNLFKGKIYEPLILELNVKDGYSKFFENVIPIKDLLAFSCESQEDVQKLFKCLRTEQKLDANIIYVKPSRRLESPSPPISEIQEFGFNHFLLELVEGPIPVLNYLCNTYRIHMIPIGTAKTLSVSESVPEKYSLFFTPNHRFAVVISKYSKQRSTESQEIVGRNLLNVTVDNGALENYKLQREEIIRASDTCRNEQGRIEAQIKEFEVKINDLDARKSQIETNYYQVTLCKQKLKRQMAKIDDLKKNAIDIDKEIEKFNKKTETILKSLSEVQKEKLDVLKKLKTAAIALKRHREKHRIFLKSTAELEHRIQEAQERLNTAIRYVNNIKAALESAKEKCKRQRGIASKLTDNKKPGDENFPYKRQFDELPGTMDELVDHMNGIQGEMECVRDYNPEVIVEYENLIRDIERLKKVIETSKSNQLNLDAQMDTIHKEWSEMILKVVNEINGNFSNFMMLMGFAGEVQLTSPNARDYADYGISIRVKYRDSEQLQGLDRFVQSGGERAVAIAAYTLSLQHMSHVPFRCVDEINQGMDPTNERRIFDMLVKETAQPGKSQFFFVTPKLLMNLTYNEYMTVSIIFNGKYVKNPKVFEKLDSGK